MSSRIRLSSAIEEFLSDRVARRWAKDTIRADRQALYMFLREVGDKQMASLRPKHVENWFYGPKGLMSEHRTAEWGSRTRRALSPATHNQYRNRLKVFFDWCTRRGYLRQDLLYDVRPMKVPARKRQRPAPGVLLAMLDHADNARDRCFIATSINTGLRSKELSGLQVSDADLDSGYLSVVITKTGEEDEVPITADLDTELRRWLLSYAEDLGRPLRPDDYLFPSRSGGLISHYVTNEDGSREMVRTPYVWKPEVAMGRTEKIIQRALDRLNLPVRYEGTHTIRRAVALAYFNDAAQEFGDVGALRETAALLHHSNLATTERYLSMTAEKNRRNRRMLGKPFLSAMIESDNVTRLKAVD